MAVVGFSDSDDEEDDAVEEVVGDGEDAPVVEDMVDADADVANDDDDDDDDEEEKDDVLTGTVMLRDHGLATAAAA